MIAAGEDFSALPAAVARTLGEDGGPRHVVVVLLDAFGWRFAQRHERHPLLARAARDGTVAPLASQFPSTTTAHVTTMHTGLPVGAHGLYEWRVFEPAAGRVVIPLLVGPDDGYDPRGLLPEGPSFYQRLAARGIASRVLSPARFSPSTYDGAAVRGAPLQPYDELAGGARAVAAAVAAAEDPLYAYLYFDGIDVAGHRFGPSSPEFDDVALRALDAVYAAFFGPEAPAIDDALLVLTADHGQVDVSPDRVDELDVLVRDLASRLTQVPAGSARDVFLHVREDRVEETVADLSTALEDRATVHAVSDLIAQGAFGTAGPRLRERLATVCVLPAPGRMAWLSTHADVERAFRGHHGGRTPDESTTFLATLPLG